MIRIIDGLMVLLPVALVAIALLLAGALRVTRARRTVDILDRRAGFGRAAGDPFFYPFGEMPIVPRERIAFGCTPSKPTFGRAVRRRDASDFRAWGIPDIRDSAAVAHRRNESGGRPSLSGTAVVLTFPTRGKHDV